MDKRKILAKLNEQLKSTLETLIRAAEDAKEAATNEESQSENKYDTRGLEASYLAGAQAKRADELRIDIDKLSRLEINDYSDSSEIGLTALVQVEVDGEYIKWLFVLPIAGGTKLEVGGNEILVITPSSPIGELLLGKKYGDVFEFSVKNNTSEYEVLKLL